MSSLTTIQTNPVTIITGFLGAGKTTYLNSILTRYPEKRFAIIENEFGEKSVDSDLIIRGEADVVELNNGCLCCTLNDNLYDILTELYQKRHDFDELIIEGTGIADPRGLASPFLTTPSVKKQFPLRQVICIVDAVLIEEQLEETEEAIHQITFSDIILISKTDLVKPARLQLLEKMLAHLNPLAKIVFGNQNNFPDLFEASPRLTTSPPPTSETSNNFETVKTAPPNHKHTKGITSFSLTFDRPFDHQKFYIKIQAFLIFQSKGLYRMKGIIAFKDKEEKYVLQSVGRQLSIDPHGKEVQSADAQTSTIVIIGKGFKKEGVRKMFEQCF